MENDTNQQFGLQINPVGRKKRKDKSKVKFTPMCHEHTGMK